MIFQLGVGVQIGPGIDNLNGGKPCINQALAVLPGENGPSDARRISGKITTQFRRQRLLQA